MDTQNTPVHIRLWNRQFWLLALANLMLVVTSTSLFVALPFWAVEHAPSAKTLYTGCGLLAFGLGTLLLGCFNSWLIEKYRRNTVCVRSILMELVMLVTVYFVGDELLTPVTALQWLPLVVLLMALAGAFFGLAEIVLTSTLNTEVCESDKRTEANYSAAWFRRLAVAVGPLLVMIAHEMGGCFPWYAVVPVAAGVLAIVLIRAVHFPFRTPDDYAHLFSSDRFILWSGWPLILNMLLIVFTFGLILSSPHSYAFYAFIALGFIVAIVAERVAFANADLRSEVVAGLIVIAAAFLMQLTHLRHATEILSPAFLGFGYGIIGSRFQLFFIKLARHCKRGSAQSTFVLTWNVAIALGLFAGYCLLTSQMAMLAVELLVAVAALLLYTFVIHGWYLEHKNR